MNLIAELPKKEPFRYQAVLDYEQNRLLASMPYENKIQFFSYLEEVDFSLHQVLCESGTTPSYMYFPTSAVTSLLYFTESGDSSEIATVGNDGVVGMSLFLPNTDLPYQAIVQTEGKGFRVRAQTAINIFSKSHVMQNILLQYSLSMMSQISKTAICNRHHSIEQQLCRRLLLALDRLQTNKLEMTHEMLAKMLGVRRESVTQSATKLQTAGAIYYKRGLIKVLDRNALESRACECYDVVKH